MAFGAVSEANVSEPFFPWKTNTFDPPRFQEWFIPSTFIPSANQDYPALLDCLAADWMGGFRAYAGVVLCPWSCVPWLMNTCVGLWSALMVGRYGYGPWLWSLF